jgi:hypothetical protein
MDVPPCLDSRHRPLLGCVVGRSRACAPSCACRSPGQIHRARRSRCFFYFYFLFFSLIPHCLGRAFPHESLLYLHIYPFQKKKNLHIYMLTGSYTMWFIHPHISSASIFSSTELDMTDYQCNSNDDEAMKVLSSICTTYKSNQNVNSSRITQLPPSFTSPNLLFFFWPCSMPKCLPCK